MDFAMQTLAIIYQILGEESGSHFVFTDLVDRTYYDLSVKMHQEQ